MTEYISTPLRLSDAQVSRLSHGLAVRLKPADLELSDNGIPVSLTKLQVARIAKARANSKGLQLKLSKAQIVASCQHKVGGSLFTSAVARFKDFVPSTETIKHTAVNLADHYTDAAIGAASGAAEKAINSVLPEWTAPFVNAGLKLGEKYTTQQLHVLLEGMKRTKSGSGLFLPGHQGSGFFGAVGH